MQLIKLVWYLILISCASSSPQSEAEPSADLCSRKPDEIESVRKCLKPCIITKDCKSKKKKCLCDGACGMSCVKPDIRCGSLSDPNYGKVHRTGIDAFGVRVFYVCDQGYRLHGPMTRACQGDGSWSGELPTCKPDVSCTLPPDVHNARHNAEWGATKFDLDTLVVYTCNPGYFQDGGFARAKCLYFNGTARWFGPDVKCLPRNCGDPGDVLNGVREGNNFYFQSTVAYRCYPGFEMVGPHYRTCQENGKWGGILPMCKAVECARPAEPKNGLILATSLTYNSLIRYECHRGYALVGSADRKCQADGTWGGQEPYCDEINCNSPGVLWNGYLDGQRTTYGAVIVFRCNPGMKFEGISQSTTCQQDGSWSHPMPRCQAPCIVPEVTNGYINGPQPSASVYHGESLNITCEDHHELVYKSVQIRCDNGTWTHIPKCEPVACSSLPKPPSRGRVIAPKTEHGMKAKFECFRGYQLIGESIITCEFGNWSGSIPECREMYCPFPGTIENGDILLVGSMGDYEYRPYIKTVVKDRQIKYECRKGYYLVDGPPGAACIDGQWSPQNKPRCVRGQHPRFWWERRKRALHMPAPCKEIISDKIKEVKISKRGTGNNTMPHGTEIQVNCAIGYQLNVNVSSHNNTAKCIRGEWKPDVPECIPFTCAIPFSENGFFSLHDKTLEEKAIVESGHTVFFTCVSGYEVLGNFQFQCLQGNWQPVANPTCRQALCRLPELRDGRYLAGYRSGLTVSHDSRIDFECNVGLIKIPQGPVTCQLGRIKPKNPICVSKSELEIVTMPPKPTEHIPSKQNLSEKTGAINPYKPCSAPERSNYSQIYKNGVLLEEDDDNFPHSTEILYECLYKIGDQKKSWRISCINEKWEGTTLTCVSEPLKLKEYHPCEFEGPHPHVVSFSEGRQITMFHTKFPHGTTLISRCTDIGKYRFIGDVYVKCNNGRWDGAHPVCRSLAQSSELDLDAAPAILFRYPVGAVTQSNDGKLIVYPGTILHLECLWKRQYGDPKWTVTHSYRKYPIGWAQGPERNRELEFRLSIYHAQKHDSGMFTCITPRGQMHSIVLEVKAVHCPTIPVSEDLYISNAATMMTSKVIFSCKKGFHLIGPSQIICLPSGKWSDLPPVCQPLTCPDLNFTDTQLRVHVTGNTYRSKARFSCQNGHGLRGPGESICQENGQWTVPLPHCEEVECSTPEVPENGHLLGTEPYQAGHLIQYSCKEGYALEGQTISVCQENGRWSHEMPLCVSSCNYPGAPIDGKILRPKFHYRVGENVEFECNEGFLLQGPSMLQCISSGVWSSAIPKCIQRETEEKVTTEDSREKNILDQML